MRSDGARAIVAAAGSGERASLKALLERAGFSEIREAGDGASALRLVCEWLPSVLVTDVVLPVLDGFSLAERILNTPLTVYPAVLIAAVPGLPARSVPAGCVVLSKPVEEETLRNALFRTAPERRLIPGSVRERAEAILDALGVPEHCGKMYLLRAIEMVWCDCGMLRSMTGRLYPAVAEAFGTDVRRTERAVRHVIDVAWRSGEIEAQYEIFGDTIDAKRGNPTCGEMIARIADILRWEGRA